MVEIRSYGTGRVLQSESSSMLFHISNGGIFDNGTRGDIIKFCDDVRFYDESNGVQKRVLE